jgi:hypothetical protein
MKQIVMTLILTFAGTVFSSTDPISGGTYDYECDGTKLSIIKNGENYTAHLSFPSNRTAHQIINISSRSENFLALTQSFNDGFSVKDDGTPLSQLPKGSIAFSGFHYSLGEMYVSAEDETNEEGFLFEINQEALTGADTVHATEIYWSDRSDSDVNELDCVRK